MHSPEDAKIGRVEKIMLVGPKEAGKSMLIGQLVPGQNARFKEKYQATLGVDFFIRQSSDKFPIKLQIFDTGGDLRFRTIIKSYYRIANQMLLVFDLSDQASLENLKPFTTEIKEFITQDNPPNLILVGTKHDIAKTTAGKTAVSEEAIATFLEENPMPYFTVSAKTEYGISALVTVLESNAMKRSDFTAATTVAPSVRAHYLSPQQPSISKSLLPTALTVTAVGFAIFKYKASLALLIAAHSPFLLVGLVVLAAIAAMAAHTAYQSYANNISRMYQPIRDPQQTERPTTCMEKLAACFPSLS